MGTGAVSRYKVYKWTKFIRVQSVVNGEGAYPGAGLKPIPVNGSKSAKSMTNNLPLLTVLGIGCY